MNLDTSPRGEPLLEAIGVGRCTVGGDRWLLRDVNATLNAGDRVAVIGPSGSGKSLLLRALALLDPHDCGEIRWRGQLVSGSQVPVYRRHVMYMHQRPPLLEGTVDENLQYPFRLKYQTPLQDCHSSYWHPLKRMIQCAVKPPCHCWCSLLYLLI